MTTLAEVIAGMPEESINATDAHFRTSLEEATIKFLTLLAKEAGTNVPGPSEKPGTDRPIPLRSQTVPVGGSSAWFA